MSLVHAHSRNRINLFALARSSDLYGTGSRILLMIISNNLRVYNTRVRSDCKSKKVILKNSRFLLISKRFAVGYFPQRLVGEDLFV